MTAHTHSYSFATIRQSCGSQIFFSLGAKTSAETIGWTSARPVSAFAPSDEMRGGMEYGATDDFCYNIVEKPVHLRDLHATILHCMGIDHSRFTYKFRGLNTRLTGVEEAHVVNEILV